MEAGAVTHTAEAPSDVILCKYSREKETLSHTHTLATSTISFESF